MPISDRQGGPPLGAFVGAFLALAAAGLPAAAQDGLAPMTVQPAEDAPRPPADVPQARTQPAPSIGPGAAGEAIMLSPAAPVARRGQTEAMRFRSVREALSVGVQQYRTGDKRAAAQALGYAAGQGNVSAQFKLGQMYADGDGVPQDDYQAFAFFLKITEENGDVSPDSDMAGVVARAFVAVGAYHLEGIPGSPVDPNPEEAYRAFHYAAAYFGDADAQYNLARMLLDGTLGRADATKAARWLKLAADKRHIYARVLLGHMLFNGDGVQRQPGTGLAWMKLAAAAAEGEKDQWVVDAYRDAEAAATDEQRRLAERLARQISER
jgi:TPR repeat protein